MTTDRFHTNFASADDIVNQLQKILGSSEFKNSQKLCNFLSFVVNRTLEGKKEFIKQSTVATHVFERPSNFDPQTDPIVRIQASRLRRALDYYYLTTGKNDSIVITIPKGSYVPQFALREVSADSSISNQNNEHSKLKKSISKTNELVIDNKQQLKPNIADHVPDLDLMANYILSDTEILYPFKIIVMPFENHSPDKEQDFFADGLSEAISTQLCRFEQVSIIAHYSGQKYKNQAYNLTDLVEDFGVQFALNGSVYCYEKHLRVYVHLSNTQTNEQLWAERFDYSLTVHNLFKIQDEIVKQTLSTICSPFGILPQVNIKASSYIQLNSLEEYEAVFRNHSYWLNPTPEKFRASFPILEEAVKQEPQSAVLLSILAQHYFDAEALGYAQIDRAIEKGISCVNKALSLDSNCQYTHYANAYASFLSQNLEKTIASAHKIITLNPNNSFMVGTAGWWLSLAGEFEQGLQFLAESLNLNPFYPNWFHVAFYLYYFQQGDYQTALIHGEKFNTPGFFWTALLKSAALAQLGELEAAQNAYQELLRLNPDFESSPLKYLRYFIILDDVLEKMLAGLYIAGLPKFPDD